MLKLPSKFLQQHGSKIRDGLTVLKLVASLGRCAGLPLDLGGMPTEVVSMAQHACRDSGPACRLVAAQLHAHAHVSHLSPLPARASPYPYPAIPLAMRAVCLRASRADRPLIPARLTVYTLC